jgi:succinate dehydrogenase flavin-adding protein (antitoxin of CptAB toxin-antitoxin module)
MSDTDMEKLEKLLNCKDRAVNKWIQEKEQHFDQMTQKLYTKSKKLISKNLKHQG